MSKHTGLAQDQSGRPLLQLLGGILSLAHTNGGIGVATVDPAAAGSDGNSGVQEARTGATTTTAHEVNERVDVTRSAAKCFYGSCLLFSVKQCYSSSGVYTLLYAHYECEIITSGCLSAPSSSLQTVTA